MPCYSYRATLCYTHAHPKQVDGVFQTSSFGGQALDELLVFLRQVHEQRGEISFVSVEYMHISTRD